MELESISFPWDLIHSWHRCWGKQQYQEQFNISFPAQWRRPKTRGHRRSLDLVKALLYFHDTEKQLFWRRGASALPTLLLPSQLSLSVQLHGKNMIENKQQLAPPSILLHSTSLDSDDQGKQTFFLSSDVKLFRYIQEIHKV